LSNDSQKFDEDLVIAWCAESLRQGSYRSALSAIPAGFSSGGQRTWESAVYQIDRRIGTWANSVKTAGAYEREKTSRISRMLAAKEINVFTEERLIEFLALRNNDQLMDELLAFANSIDPSAITPETSPGILECDTNLGKWKPNAKNPFENHAERACKIAAEGLQRTQDNVFVFSEGQAGTALNLRLGTALLEWGEKSGKTDWAALGRSLILSVLSLAEETAPVTLASGRGREFIASQDRIGSARLYRMLGINEFLPRETSTGTSGIWAWTVSSSVNVTQTERQIDIRVGFPVGETHYVMLRNVRPFALLQMHDSNWRNAYDFESYYDSSGWYYFEGERTLVLKIRHRLNTEHIKILFSVPRVEPPPPPPPPPEEAAQAETQQNSENNPMY
jgi:hypothetical protein